MLSSWQWAHIQRIADHLHGPPCRHLQVEACRSQTHGFIANEELAAAGGECHFCNAACRLTDDSVAAEIVVPQGKHHNTGPTPAATTPCYRNSV